MNKNELQAVKASGALGFADELPSKPDIPAPPVKVRGLMLGLIGAALILFGGIGYWSYQAKIQSAVVANGSFEVDGNLQVVQHLEGGIVREITVREGDTVKRGQIIAVLDESRAKAQSGILKSQLLSAVARRDRLRAEYVRAETLTFSREVDDIVAQNAMYDTVIPAQQTLFKSNQNTEFGQVAILTERIAQLNEELMGIQERNKALIEQRELVGVEVRDLQQLLDRKLTTKARFLARRQLEAELIGDIGENEGRMSSVQQQISEMEERILQVRRDRNLAIADDLQNVEDEIFSIRQRLDAAVNIEERLKIRAPVSGRVVGFDLNTVGSIVQPGETLLKIVPEDSSYIVEARVRPGDIDEVKLGGAVRIRLSSYSFRSTPPIDGSVIQISADSFFDPTSQEPYYLTKIAVSKPQLDDLENVEVLPSMPVQVMIATGEQTVLTYLTDPVLAGLETAMVEGE